jgi:hypothetical protein
MKRIILVVVFLAAVCAASSLISYRAGFARAKQLQKGTFVGTIDALQKLRAGDVAGGTQRIESLCFSAADMLYSDPDYRDQIVTKTFAPELIQYRATFRTNSAEWTPAEQKLEHDLASWR